MSTMTLRQAAKEINRTPQTVTNWCNRLKIPIKLGALKTADVARIKVEMAKSKRSQASVKNGRKGGLKKAQKVVPKAASRPKKPAKAQRNALVGYLAGSATTVTVPLTRAHVAVLTINGHKPEAWAREILDHEIRKMAGV